jgi:hypothetical protein
VNLAGRRGRATLAVACLVVAALGGVAALASSSGGRPAPGRTHPAASPSADGTGGGPPGWVTDAGARVFRPFTKGFLLGVYTGGQPLTGFGSQVATAALTVTYVHWGTPVAYLAQLIASAAQHKAEAILELEPGAFGHNASQIAAGTGGSDSWLRQFGQTVRALRYPVAVSFFPEMNGPWHARWSRGPASYVRAYRHVHALLSSLAGPWITWFWQVSAIHKDTPSPMPWWPGGGDVDVAALDSYYYYQHDTFTAIFGRTIALIRRAGPRVPIMIGETATGPLFGRQVTEIGDLFAGVRRAGLIGLVWFNQYQHKPPYQFHQDWRLQDHPAALAAFRRFLAANGPLARLKRAA